MDLNFLSGILPWYGSVANAHALDRVTADLENQIILLIDSFAADKIQDSAACMVSLQNRVALSPRIHQRSMSSDWSGMLYIHPNESGNITHVIHHLNTLLNKMHLDDFATSGGWDTFGWLKKSFGSWCLDDPQTYSDRICGDSLRVNFLHALNP